MHGVLWSSKRPAAKSCSSESMIPPRPRKSAKRRSGAMPGLNRRRRGRNTDDYRLTSSPVQGLPHCDEGSGPAPAPPTRSVKSCRLGLRLVSSILQRIPARLVRGIEAVRQAAVRADIATADEPLAVAFDELGVFTALLVEL